MKPFAIRSPGWLAFTSTVLAVYLLSGPAFPTVHTFSLTLDGLQEVPPNPSPGVGNATVTLDDVSGAVTVSGSYSGLLGAQTLAHIHGPAPVGVNAGVILPLVGTGGMAGSLNGAGVLTPVQVADMLAGLNYVNVHSSMFGGGEIRGQIILRPAAVTPACAGDGSYPSSSALFCPCGNTSPLGAQQGCMNSSFAVGGTLRDIPGSSTSVVADALGLVATFPARNSGLMLINTSIINPGVALFEGVLCVGGGPRVFPGADDGMVHLYGDMDLVGGDGMREMGTPLPGGGIYGLVNAFFPGYFVPGVTYWAQYWYRDVLCGPPPAPCVTPCVAPPMIQANFTNAVTWIAAP